MVLERTGAGYRVLLDGITFAAVLRGKARRQEERAVAGDRVRCDQAHDPATDAVLAIASVEPRKSLLERRIPGGRGSRPVAANVDQVVVVVATAEPEPNLQLLDRLLVVAEANDLPVCVVVNKVDLGSAAPIATHLRATEYAILPTSARQGDGIEALRERLVDRESVFTGPSGAGKSSLLNSIDPTIRRPVGEVSQHDRRGTHTTVSAALIPLAAGGFVVDTPGFSDVGMWAIDRAHLDECFPEFRALIGTCRFDDCTHRGEPTCAVRGATENGAVPSTRYQSYLTLFAELIDLPEEWQ